MVYFGIKSETGQLDLAVSRGFDPREALQEVEDGPLRLIDHG